VTWLLVGLVVFFLVVSIVSGIRTEFLEEDEELRGKQ
jgi:hypothetical protein